MQSYGPVVEQRAQVTDVRALRALAHPLRNRLLGLLRLDGPSTATLLGRRVGESSGATSYHLRQLQAYGFVEEVPERGTGRERWWRACHRLTSWQAADVVAQEGGEDVQEELTRLQVDGHGRVLHAWRDQRADLGEAWTPATSLSDYALRLTPEQARALADELGAVVDRWLAEHPTDVPAAGSELVAVLVDVVPLREWPGP